jgi:hypothetical protein
LSHPSLRIWRGENGEFGFTENQEESLALQRGEDIKDSSNQIDVSRQPLERPQFTESLHHSIDTRLHKN